MEHKVLLYGGTGQSKMMIPIIQMYNQGEYKVVAVIDDTEDLPKPFEVDTFICGKNAYERWKKQTEDYKNYNFVITIGNPHGQVRRNLYKKLENDGLKVFTCLHPCSQINSWIGRGVQIHSHAIVNPFAKVKDYCILNTRSLVEHDCILEEGVELGPNATLCGEVTVGENTWIGAGSTVLPGIKIGKNVIVGAGSVVTKDISDNEVWHGNPAEFKRNI